MAKKMGQDKPGWFLVWDKIDPEDEAALAPFRLEKMASYPAFDDDTRTVLILYKLTSK
jgi:hypothetical protein